MISAEVAKKLAEDQYSLFRARQDAAFESDFEREVKRIADTSRSGEDGADS